MKIAHCRVSSIWVEAFPGLLCTQGTSSTQGMGRLAGLLDRAVYADLFNALLATDSDALVELPWPRKPGSTYPERNNYWNDVIVRNLCDHRSSNGGLQAFRSVIPLKHKPVLVKLDRADRSFVEGWYYPDGVALTVTFWLLGALDADELPRGVAGLLQDPRPVTWPDGSQENLLLDKLAKKCLGALRQQGFGAVAPGYQPNPIRMLTIIRAEHESQDRRADEEAVMLKAALSTIGIPDGDLKPQRDIYWFSQSLVIWRPDRFVSKLPNLHTLGCLHRNAAMAAMHVASLLRAAAVLVAKLDDHPGQPVPFPLDHYARAVAGSLGRMYGGVDTYSLPWIRSQIGKPNETSIVNRLRDKLNLSPLA